MGTSADHHRRRVITGMALTCMLLSVLVVAVSAYLRLQGAGLGCADWPDCYGQVLLSSPHAPREGARLIQRLVATTALLAGIVLVWRTLHPQPLRPAARYAALLLALMLFLSIVGIWSSDPRRGLANFINILGGLGLVSFSWRVAITARPPETRAAAGPILRAGFVMLTATVLLGALIGARYAATACTTVPDCQGVWWPNGTVWSALHPFVILEGPGDDKGLHLLHRYGAFVATVLLALAAWRIWPVQPARPAATMVLLLLGVEITLGVLTVGSGFGLWLAIAHNIGAALLLAAAASLMWRTE